MATVQEDTRYKKTSVRLPLLANGKQSHRMMRSSALNFTMQVVASGGETNMHAHSNIDSIWYVLQGEATFYGEENRVLAVLKPHEWLFIEHGSPYWFEGTGSENLVLQHFSAIVPGIDPKRIDYEERKFVIDGPGYNVAGDREKGMTDRTVKPLEGQFFGN
jgi:mannose-6-phosphate isomerase-like protein (cupin superfamily)